MAKYLAISSCSFGLQSVAKGGSRGEKYPPHETFTRSDFCGGAGVKLTVPRADVPLHCLGVGRVADWPAQDSE